MESICFTSKNYRRCPDSKVVRFEDYQREPELEDLEVAFSPQVQKRMKRHTMRRRLEAVCLVLEVVVCLAILGLAITAAVRFWLS